MPLFINALQCYPHSKTVQNSYRNTLKAWKWYGFDYSPTVLHRKSVTTSSQEQRCCAFTYYDSEGQLPTDSVEKLYFQYGHEYISLVVELNYLGYGGILKMFDISMWNPWLACICKQNNFFEKNGH
jgi:hypothetical protein